MSNKIIGIDEYGSFVKNEKNENVCHKCMYFNYHKHAEPCKSCLEVYYYPNHLEIAKLEAEQPLCADTYNSDSQKELIDLQNENKQLKERVALYWWKDLPMGRTFDIGFKQYLRDKYYPNRKISSLSEKEIEYIYICEVKQQ